MLQHNFVSHQDRSSSSHKVFHYSNADWESLRNLVIAYPWYSGLSIDPSLFATFLTTAIGSFLVCHLPHYRNWPWYRSFYSISLITLARSLLQSRSIHVKKLSNIKTTALNNRNYITLCIQELYLYKLVTYAPKPSIMPKPPLSNVSTIKLLHVKQDVAPSGP